MKTALHSKFPPFFIVFLILIQSCTVYHSASVDIEEAVKSHNKVKIKTNSKEIYRFKNIIEKDNLYYGIAKANRNSKIPYPKNGKVEKYSKNLFAYPLELKKINRIYTKNRELSTILSIGIPLVIASTTIILIVQSLDFDLGYDSF